MSVVQATFCATLVDEWVRAGVAHAVVCPGSRSTPLALALAERGDVQVHVRLDERAAGFFAVGLALATGRPTVVCVTSGTAAAELHPSVVEAHHAGVPLIVCTADRPPELHGVGAPQTIEQAGLYGPATRWSAEPGVPVEQTSSTWRSLGARAVAEATLGPLGPGPVHLNLAFREPLVARASTLPPGDPHGRPWHRVSAPPGTPHRLDPWTSGRGVLVAGRGCGPPDAVLALAEHLGWPVLADPRSGCRTRHPNVIGAADALARVAPLRRRLAPDVVVRLGDPWASRALAAWLSAPPEEGRVARTVAVSEWWRWEDPERTVGERWRCDPASWLAAIGELPAPDPADGWLEHWRAAEHAAQQAVDEALGDELSEPAVARRLYAMAPALHTVVVASSMPVRDLEWFAPPWHAPPVVASNRGANGIDGVASTALGVAAAGGGPVVGVLGDLAFLHDVSGLVRSVDAAPADCSLVVLDNGGGGIFEFLPQAAGVERDRFEQLYGTRQSADVARVAEGFGLACADVGTLDELGRALGVAVGRPRTDVVRVRVPDRRRNVDIHERVHAAVDAAVRRLR